MTQFYTTPEYFKKQKEAYILWQEGNSSIPPKEIPLHDRFIKKTIYNVLGSDRVSALPRVEQLCRNYAELNELREYVWNQLRNKNITQLSSLCSEVGSRVDRIRDPEALRWAKFYQGLIARRIQRKKIEMPDFKADYHRGIEMPQMIQVSKRITERIFVALDEMSTRAALPDEAFFEMQMSMAHTLKSHLERFTLRTPGQIKKMFEKAYHSVREAISGVFVLEQENSVSVWGSARSCKWYDVIAEEVAYNSAKNGFSCKTGAGPGTMNTALKGCHRFIEEELARGRDPKVEAIGLPGNFVKLKEQPSRYMTYRIDHYDLDIRKLLLRTSNVILVFPGRAGTDEELYTTLVELLTDYSNIAEEDKFALPNIVIVGDYQRKALLYHIVIEMKKYLNVHNDSKPLFYFVDLDHEALRAEHEGGDQLSCPKTQEYIQLLTDVVAHCARSKRQDLANFLDQRLANSIQLREKYIKLELK